MSGMEGMALPVVEEFQIDVEEGIAILALNGWLDFRTYEELEAALDELLRAGCYRVIVDMGKVEYISSAGAGSLMNAFSQCAGHQGRLVLVNLTPSVLEVLEVLNLNGVFQTMPDIESALAALRTDLSASGH